MTDLDARYERLLFAYPREYRRRRGAEIAATFTEMAPRGNVGHGGATLSACCSTACGRGSAGPVAG